MSVRVAQLLQMAVSMLHRPNANSWPGSPKDSDRIIGMQGRGENWVKQERKREKKQGGDGGGVRAKCSFP